MFQKAHPDKSRRRETIPTLYIFCSAQLIRKFFGNLTKKNEKESAPRHLSVVRCRERFVFSLILLFQRIHAARLKTAKGVDVLFSSWCACLLIYFAPRHKTPSSHSNANKCTRRALAIDWCSMPSADRKAWVTQHWRGGAARALC